MSASPDLIDGVIDSVIWSDDRVPNGNRPILWVVHSPEFPEVPDGAERVAQYLATSPRLASVHFCGDNNSVVRTARDTDRVYGAGGANDIGLHFELTGYAGQTAEQWRDEYSLAAIRRMAKVFAEVAHKYWDIPPKVLTDAELRTRTTAGIVTHAQCVRVFGGDHWDPGPHFPMEYFASMCRQYTSQGDIMPFHEWWKQFNRADPTKYDPVVAFFQWGLRQLTDANGNPYYGAEWRRDGKRGPITEAAWRNFERDRVPRRGKGNEIARSHSYSYFLKALGR